MSDSFFWGGGGGVVMMMVMVTGAVDYVGRGDYDHDDYVCSGNCTVVFDVVADDDYDILQRLKRMMTSV